MNHFVVPRAVDLVPFLFLLALALGMISLRRRNVLAEPLKGPARIGQWIVFALAALALAEAFTDLPIFEVLQTLRNVVNYEFTTLGTVQITPVTITMVIGVVLGSWWLSTVARDGLVRLLLSRNIGDEGSVAAIARLTQYALVGIGMMVGLQTMGLDLSAVFAAGAVFAVGFGLAMQHVTENFVSGVILLVERSIRPGDILELESGEMIRVQFLGIRSTLARTLDDEEVILPNSLLVQSKVKNLRLSDTNLRIRVQVGVSYDSDLERTMAALQRAAATFPLVDHRPPVVLLTGFGASSVDFDVSVWTRSPWDRPRVRSELGLAVWEALKTDGITIAYPQLDVHVDDQLVEALSKA